jgi:hypothetical protein
MIKVDYTVSGRSVTLSEATDADYQDRGSRGYETRREIRRDAQILADTLGKSVEIYSSDGIVYEQISPSEELPALSE